MRRVRVNRPNWLGRKRRPFVSGLKPGRRRKMVSLFLVVRSLLGFSTKNLTRIIHFGEPIIYCTGWGIPLFAHARNMKRSTLSYKRRLKKLHPDTGYGPIRASRPKNRGVWFQDEARFGQQGTMTRVWALRGSRPRVVRQTKYEWLYVIGAVCPETGQTVGLLSHGEFNSQV